MLPAEFGSGERTLLHLRPAPTGPSPDWTSFCQAITPAWRVLNDGPLLDLTGSDRLWGRGCDRAAALSARAHRFSTLAGAGVGPSLLVARLASRYSAHLDGRSVFVVAPGGASSFLAPFPISVFPAARGVVSRLAQLGVRTLGDLQLVPGTLLRAVFGPGAESWPEQASGQPVAGEGEDGNPATPPRLLVGVRLHHPASSPAHRQALLDGLAFRAMAVCPGGPAARLFWELEATICGRGVRRVRRRGQGPASLAGWRDLLRHMAASLDWGRLAMQGLALWAGPPQAVSGQMDLFPADRRQDRLTRALAGVNQGDRPLVAPGNQALLTPLGPAWYGADPRY